MDTDGCQHVYTLLSYPFLHPSAASKLILQRNKQPCRCYLGFGLLLKLLHSLSFSQELPSPHCPHLQPHCTHVQSQSHRTVEPLRTKRPLRTSGPTINPSHHATVPHCRISMALDDVWSLIMSSMISDPLPSWAACANAGSRAQPPALPSHKHISISFPTHALT